MARRVAAIVVGAVFGVLTDVAIQARWPRSRVPASAAILVAAAAAYPLARLGKAESPGGPRREWVALGATVGVFVVSRSSSDRVSFPLTAAAWVGHAVFDGVHERGEASLLPGWYPALCAGYDLGMATMLCRAALDRRTSDR
jgi:hypothetical protein